MLKHSIVLIIYILFTNAGWSQTTEVKFLFKDHKEKGQDSVISVHFSNKSSSLKRKTDSIKLRLQKHGFMQVRTEKLTRVNDSVYVQDIILDKQFSFLKITEDYKITLKNLSDIPLSRKREHIIKFNEYDHFIAEYSQKLKENGYPFNQLQLSKIKITKSDTISATLSVRKNSIRHIDDIRVKGYHKFPEKTLGTSKIIGRKYNENSIAKISEIINTMPFVETTKPAEILFKKDSTIVYLYLKKVNTNTAEGLLGFNNSENGKLELNGFINLKLENNLNKAETFILEYRNDNQDQTKLKTSIDVPYLWKSPIGINSEIDIQRRDSTYQRTIFTAGLFIKPNWQTNIGINYTDTSSNATGTEPAIEDLTKKGVEGYFSYESINNNPLIIEDISISGHIGYANRNRLEKKEKQFNLDATFQRLWHLSNRSKFLSRLTSYYLRSDNIQFNELYQFGGLGSIRGFNQNSIDSSFYTTVATEYRYLLNDQIYIHSILDLGVFENFITKKLDKLYGLGGGIAILTQAGILNLSIANGRFEDAKVDLSSTVAHINLKINF